MVWRLGVVVITTVQLHLTKSQLRFCTSSNPAHGLSDIRDCENLWQWSLWEVRLSSVKHSAKTIHHHHLYQLSDGTLSASADTVSSRCQLQWQASFIPLPIIFPVIRCNFWYHSQISSRATVKLQIFFDLWQLLQASSFSIQEPRSYWVISRFGLYLRWYWWVVLDN